MTAFDLRPGSNHAVIAGYSNDNGIVDFNNGSTTATEFSFIQIFNPEYAQGANDLDFALREFALNTDRIAAVRWGGTELIKDDIVALTYDL